MKGRGIGTELMRRAGTWIKERFPHAGVHLWVFEANTGALGFYERLGGVRADRKHKEVPGGGTATSICCVWSSVDLLVARAGGMGEPVK